MTHPFSKNAVSKRRAACTLGMVAGLASMVSPTMGYAQRNTGWVKVGADSIALTGTHGCYSIVGLAAEKKAVSGEEEFIPVGVCGSAVPELALTRAAARELVVAPGSLFEVRFEPATTRISVTPRGWAGLDPRFRSKEQFQVPDTAGVYLYAVHAVWANGNGDWLFQLRVRPK